MRWERERGICRKRGEGEKREGRKGEERIRGERRGQGGDREAWSRRLAVVSDHGDTSTW